MHRRNFNALSASSFAALIALVHMQARALSLGDLTNAEASQGLKTALEKGALAAVSLLGKTDQEIAIFQDRVNTFGSFMVAS